MTSDLELTACVYYSLPSAESASPACDNVHQAFVSRRLYQALTGPMKHSNQPLVCIRGIVSGQRIVCDLRMVQESTESYFSAGTTGGNIHLSPSVFGSLHTASPRVHVGLLQDPLQAGAAIYLSELDPSSSHVHSVHRLAISNFLSVSRYLSTGETIAVPAWNSANLFGYNEVAESGASVESWIGPGRTLDSTFAVIHYRISRIQAADGSELLQAVCDASCKVLMVSSRKSEMRGPIPGIRGFLFPDVKIPVSEEVRVWVTAETAHACMVVGKSGSERLTIVTDTIFNSGLFFHTLNCALFADCGSLIAQVDRVGGRFAVLVLDNFENLNLQLSSISHKFRKIVCLVEEFEKVVDNFQFSTLVDLGNRIGKDDTGAAYRAILAGDSELEESADKRESDRNKRLQSAIEASAAPNVTWADIGGLEEAKAELRDLMTEGLRRGVLLFGPPGTGKTLLAKAIASESHASNTQFISVKGPELLSMYIGESERNIRSVFEAAIRRAPCVIFFDEIDSLAPSRGRSSDSANVMDRVVASLLTEIDALPEGEVLLVAATNRPDLLDPALLRPGRIDRQVYVGIPQDKAELLHALSRQFRMSPSTEVVVETVKSQIPKSMTGSDLAGLLRRAHLRAAKAVAGNIEKWAAEAELSVSEFSKILHGSPTFPVCETHAFNFFAKLEKCTNCPHARIRGVSFSASDLQVQITAEEIIAALAFLRPSVTDQELREYDSLRDRRATVVG